MTLAERTETLTALGFTPRQARFLAIVALHSGYCVRRQYQTFAGIQSGRNVYEFFNGLVTRGLAVPISGRADRGCIYHLHARGLYRAIGEEHNRNRRPVSAAHITRKLMLLDFVLSQPTATWYATEREKVALFAVDFQLPLDVLPRRLFRADGAGADTMRFFIHKLPIFVPADATPRPHFVYLATSDSAPEFAAFLRDHEALLHALGTWTVVVVSQRQRPSLDGMFHRFAHAPPGARVTADLEWFFERRRIVESGDLARVSVGDLQRYRELRRRYDTAAVHATYAAWLTSGAAALTALAQTPAWNGELQWALLSAAYEQFGLLPGVA